jgi:moderate conductance mechanosensitive channel
MDELLNDILSEYASTLLLLFTALLLLLFAIVVAALSRRLARLLLRLGYLAPRERRPSPERRNTLEGLVGSAIAVGGFAVCLVATLSLFIDTNTLLWVIGLFSAAFGFGARGLVTDFLAGAGFIFRNTFDLGEKVELTMTSGVTVQGNVEDVTLRNTEVRSPDGELYTLPNGEIGVVRNFSRGTFSTAKVTLTLAPGDMQRCAAVLEELGREAAALLPQLLEPWQIVPGSELSGGQVRLTIIARANHGQAARLKLEILPLIHRRLTDAGMFPAA